METACATVELLTSLGVKVTTLKVEDDNGNKAKLKYNTAIEESGNCPLTKVCI